MKLMNTLKLMETRDEPVNPYNIRGIW